MAGESDKSSSRSREDKEKSRAQSRPVSGGKVGAASARNRPPAKPQGNQARREAQRKGQSTSSRPAPRRSPATLLAWGTVALVIVIVAVLVVVKLTSTTSGNGPTPGWTAASLTVVNELTNIPASVYNEVGVNSTAVPVTPPTVSSGHPPLLFNNMPGVFYFGAEFCP